jgi:hypothetical protein
MGLLGERNGTTAKVGILLIQKNIEFHSGNTATPSCSSAATDEMHSINTTAATLVLFNIFVSPSCI